jgi:leucyl aminopeptidase
VLGEKEMKKLGMGALLGVGQGSERESQLVVMQWKGAGRAKPVAFVGKGVTFDTGGISIKPAAGMEEMKWDMAGAGAVIGVMRALAGRKAKVNAVGVCALVENMPSGSAQRPGDIVTSMSGQTIEVLNTDAEGRLILADALWYTQGRFKPQFMIDLATLTGAMIVALGHEYAGLFSNDDELASRLFEAGKAEDEGVWRLPLGDAYDKQINSDAADMQNIGANRAAGAITAAAVHPTLRQQAALGASRHRRHRLGGLHVRRPRRRPGRGGPRPVEDAESGRPRGDLLAADAGTAMGAQGMMRRVRRGHGVGAAAPC